MTGTTATTLTQENSEAPREVPRTLGLVERYDALRELAEARVEAEPEPIVIPPSEPLIGD